MNFLRSMIFALMLACLTVSGSAMEWPMPDYATVRQELSTWLDAENVTDPAKRSEILTHWPHVQKLSGSALFELTIESMRRASVPVASFLESCDNLAWRELPFGQPLVLPQIPLQIYLSDAASSKYLLGTLRFYLASRLIQARLYDEAAPLLEEITADGAVDPLGVLLARAVIANHLGDTKKGLAAMKEFRKTQSLDLGAPRRYSELAKLLEFDMKRDEKKEDPENIARKMGDVRRRLGKGRTDDDTQQAEKDVMKSLEKLIEKIEDQCKKQGECEAEGQQANKPADDSRILKQKGPGNVDRRDFDTDGNWGDLPPKEREEALIKIEKEFPPHYRDIIEQYFREMAN